MDVNEFQNYVHMPNEIYSDFTRAFAELKEETDNGTRSSHIAYAFGYTFLAHYMWRYARFYTWNNAKGSVPINEAIIKQMLGFPAKSEAYTWLTKNKTGFLEQIGYINKVTDKPIAYYHDEDRIDLFFSMESECGSPDKVNHKGWKVAMPVKGMWRNPEDKGKYTLETGTFHIIDNTHMIDMDTFIYCITNPELGVEGFYLYSFLKFMTDKFNNAFDCSNMRMARMTGLSVDEIKNQINNLERYNMITNDHKPYCLDKPKDKKCKANTYGILEHDQFAKNLMQMNVIPKQVKISKERYKREVGWANEREIDGNIIDTDTGEIIRSVPNFTVDDIEDMDMEDLPFEFQ
ncbi:hypothetical protein [Brevibacillus brevis]|uniref:Uncharacterized protein n=1 Tax=Brevibacillus brevis TaxID=1393 RepID=A0ABY9T5X1_BREBE|nr:hypothetical protein [Brevibacillus brevis]WNC14879.1 hypothetical protein RGB73_00310 [Brevibacillus brevis]